jgi:hypothetical protein
LQLTDVQGRVVNERHLEVAGEIERQTLGLGLQSTGLFILRATSGNRSVTVNVLKH